MATVDPWSLPAVATGDDYSAAATIAAGPEVAYVGVAVFTAAVYYQLEVGSEWQPEVFLTPWVGTLSRAGVTGIRFRSAVVGKPATVNARLVTEGGADVGSVPNYTLTPGGEVSNVSGLPPGSIVPYAGTGEPSSDWLFCDGRAVNRTDYSALFGIIGATYGAGDGVTTFNLPDLRGRLVVGLGSHPDVATLGNNDGTAVAARRPKHKHTVASDAIKALGGTGAPGGSEGTTFPLASITVGPQTGSEPTDTPAYVVLNYLIHT